MYYLRTRPAADAIPFTVDPASGVDKQRPARAAADNKSALGSDGLSRENSEDLEVHGDVCISCQG